MTSQYPVTYHADHAGYEYTVLVPASSHWDAYDVACKARVEIERKRPDVAPLLIRVLPPIPGVSYAGR